MSSGPLYHVCLPLFFPFLFSDSFMRGGAKTEKSRETGKVMKKEKKK
jgi:hypothetical protein